MIKSFWYLWIIVLIFPTFGFTTGMAVIENVLGKDNHTEPVFRWNLSIYSGIWAKLSYNISGRWDCIFLPDSGAFFVNYVSFLWQKKIFINIMVSRQVTPGQVPVGQVPWPGTCPPGTCPPWLLSSLALVLPGTCPPGTCPPWHLSPWHLSGHWIKQLCEQHPTNVGRIYPIETHI